MKPLHVQVAEALGLIFHEPCPLLDSNQCAGKFRRPEDPDGIEAKCVLHYDTDWAATGPLIERIAGFQMFGGGKTRPADKRYCAYVMSHAEGWGPTPLIATCNLIIALHKAGKI